jgi:hypothetical protein
MQGLGESSKPHFIAHHIRYTWVDDRVIILDLQSEAYFALDPTASLMWQQLALGHDREHALQYLLARHSVDSVDSDQIERDFAGFVEKCRESGWLVNKLPPTATRSIRSSASGQIKGISALAAWWALYRTSRSLSTRGFSATYAALSELAQLEMGHEPDERTISAALRAFTRAEEFFHLKSAPADCLPRSLALFRFLRQVGVPVEHCIGVDTFPFSAHAWAQYQGRVVHDAELNPKQYTIIAKLPP